MLGKVPHCHGDCFFRDSKLYGDKIRFIVVISDGYLF